MSNNQRRFGTFEGVFTPTILTILGVIMYLRLGWVVGNAGFGGALLIILLSKLVTVSTGLAISAMTTNIKIGAGGSYALVSRSLGAEVGSAIGIPLYFSQALGGALYIAGFTEGWLTLFPAHSPHVVATCVLVVLFIVSLISAKAAMKIQFIIMAIIFLSLISFFWGKGEGAQEIVLWGNFSSKPFWLVFAIFFPAVTGIEAGAAMSGDLKDPRKSMPRGILSAIGLSMVIYILVAYWLDRQAPSNALIQNYTIMIDLARWRFLVTAGILGATLSSALGSIVGGPRTLMALGQDKVLPYAKVLAKQSKNGEPRYAIIFTAIVIEISLLLGDLNTIAPLLTMFFLITYGTINLAVVIEKGIKIPSYRPSFNIPLIIPLVGGLWCFIVMFLINPIFAAIAILFILVVYLIQVKRGMISPWGDVRSGLFNAIAEWAAKTAARMPHHAKTWKFNLMIPIEDPKHWSHLMEFIRDIIFPGGTLRLFSARILETGVQQKINRLVDLLFLRQEFSQEEQVEESAEELEQELNELTKPVKKEGIFTAATVVECQDFLEGMNIIVQVLRGMFFPPNTIFLTMSADRSKDSRFKQLLAISIREKMGILVLSLHPKAAFGTAEKVNIWLRVRSPNRDLAILTALQLHRNWNAGLRLITVIPQEEDRKQANIVLQTIVDRARMPAETEILIYVDEFKKTLAQSPRADLNIFGMSDNMDIDEMHELARLTETSCLFVKDSGEESALA